jgi:hypothetical protein
MPSHRLAEMELHAIHAVQLVVVLGHAEGAAPAQFWGGRAVVRRVHEENYRDCHSCHAVHALVSVSRRP